MVKQSNQTKQRQPLTWQMVLVCLLATLGLIAFTSFTLVNWVERQILTTDTWVQTVSQLPKDDSVATALSTYTINQLFSTTDLETKVEEALPDRAGFLAAPITSQLQTFLTARTKDVIQSDQFQTVWITANRAVLERLVNGAREPTTETSSEPAQLSVPLTVLRNSINTVLTNQGVIPENSNETGQSELVVNLKASVATIQEQIRLVDFLNATLWLVAIVCITGALVFSRNRRRLLLIIAVAVIVITLLQLIGVRALRPAVLNFFADATQTTSSGIVYDTLLESFRQSTIGILITAIIGFIIVFLLSPKILRKSKTASKWLDALKASSAYTFWGKVRGVVAKYQWYIVGVSVLIGLALAAFLIPISWQSATLTILSIILIAEVTSLMAAGTRRRMPM